MWAIIGGSGFEKFEGVEVIKDLDPDTPFGRVASGFKKVKIGSQECLFISRHGQHHELLPSEINYRAHIFALKKWGAKAIISLSAVGSLREDLKPGDLVVPTQYVDRTKGLRSSSFCGQGLVGHVSLAHPVCPSLAQAAVDLATQQKLDVHGGKTYVCIEGPYFSTLAESLHYRDLHCDIIGMTNFPEFALAREAGLPYLPLCFVTDYDCWDTHRPHVELEQILMVMRQNNHRAFQLIQKILQEKNPLYLSCECSRQSLKSGLMTPLSEISARQREWLEVLLR